VRLFADKLSYKLCQHNISSAASSTCSTQFAQKQGFPYISMSEQLITLVPSGI